MGVKKQSLTAPDWNGLAELGFESSPTRDGIWELAHFKNKNPKKWQFKYLSIDTARTPAQLQECEIHLSFAAISEAIVKHIQKVFAVDIKCDVIKCKDGDIFVSINTPITSVNNSCPQSYIGFKFFVYRDFENISCYFYDYIAVQQPPVGLMNEAAKAIQQLFSEVTNKDFNLVKQNTNLAMFLSGIFLDFFKGLGSHDYISKLGSVLFDAQNENVQCTITDQDIRISYVYQNETGCRPRLVGLPINALEVEEVHRDYMPVIQKLSQGDYTEAFTEIMQNLSSDSPKLALDLYGYAGLNSKNSDLVDIDLKLIYDSMSAWSYFIQVVMQEQHSRNDEVLDELSAFAAELLKFAPESLESHGYLLAEILGDLWAKRDPAVAHKFYRSILSRFGDVPRVLAKVVAISSQTVPADEEIALLKKTLKISDEDNDYLARLVDLYASQGKIEDAIHFGLKALQNPASISAPFVEKIAQLYVNQQQIHQALKFLEFYTSEKYGFDKPDLARLNLLAGDLWQNHLKRPKLALRRYLRALQEYPQLLEAYDKLEFIYESGDDWRSLTKLLLEKIKVLPPTSLKSLNSYYKICHGVIEYGVDDTEKWQAFEVLSSRNLLTDSEIDRSLSESGNEKVNWSEVAKSIESSKQDVDNEIVRSSRMVLLGRIYNEKLGDQKKSVEYIKGANKFSKIDTRAFRFLVDQSSNQEQDLDQGEMLVDRLKHLEDSAKQDFLRNIKEPPENVAMSDLKSLIVQQYTINDGQKDLFLATCDKIHGAGDVDKILAFFNMVFTSLEDNVRVRFLRESIELLPERYKEASGELSIALFEHAKSCLHSYDDFANLVIPVLQKQPHKIFADMTSELLERGFGQVLGLDAVKQILEDRPEAIANYLLSEADKTPHSHKKHSLAEKAMEVVNKLDAPSEQRVNLQKRVFSTLSEHGTLSGVQIAEYRKLAEQNQLWIDYAKSLQEQMNKQQSEAAKVDYSLELANIYEQHLKSDEDAYHHYVSAIRIDSDKTGIRLKIAELAHKLGKEYEEKNAWSVLLKETDFEDLDLMKQALEGCARTHKKEELEGLLVNKVQDFISHDASEEALEFLNLVFSYKLYTYSLLMLKASLSKSVEDVFSLLVRTLDYIQDEVAWHDHLNTVDSILENHGMILDDLYVYIHDKSAHDKVATFILRDVYTSIANKAYAQEDSAKAYEIYTKVFRLDQTDMAMWLPYYKVMRQHGDVADIKSYLEFLVPQVEENSGLLAGYDFDIKALKKDARHVAEGVHPKEADEMAKQETIAANISEQGFVEEKTHLQKAGSEVLASIKEGTDSKDSPTTVENAPETTQEEEVATPEVVSEDEEAASEPIEFPVDDVEKVDATAAPVEGEPAAPEDKPSAPEEEATPVAPEPKAYKFEEVAEVEPQKHSDPSTESALKGSSIDLYGIDESAQNPLKSETAEGDLELDFGLEGEGSFSGSDEDTAVLPSNPSAMNIPDGEEGLELEVGDETTPKEESSTTPTQSEVVEPVAQDAPPSTAKDTSGSQLDQFEITFGGGSMTPQASVAASNEQAATHEGSSSGSFLGSLQSVSSASQVAAQVPTDSETMRLEDAPSMNLHTSHTNNTGQSASKAYEWRNSIGSRITEPSIVNHLLRAPFEKELEKHLALQATSIVSGNFEALQSWHMPIWRDAKTWSYSTDASGRVDEDIFKDILKTDLFSLFVYLTPVLVQLFDAKFTFETMAAYMKVDPVAMLAQAQIRPWQQGILEKCGIYKYAPRLEKTGYQAFHLAGLGKQIFYDGRRRAIFFDETYYQNQPPGHLLFGILSEVWGVRLGYHVCLNLHSKDELFAVLKNIVAFSNMTSVQKVKLKVTQRQNPLVQYLLQVTPQKMESFVEAAKSIEARDIAMMQFAMRDHLNKILLAESLNLIGLVEYIVQRDLLASGNYSYEDLVRENPHVESLVSFAKEIQI